MSKKIFRVPYFVEFDTTSGHTPFHIEDRSENEILIIEASNDAEAKENARKEVEQMFSGLKVTHLGVGEPSQAEYWFRPKDVAQQSDRLIEAFQKTIEKVVNSYIITHGLSIVAMANLNFHEVEIPVNIFRNIDYGKIGDEDAVVLGELVKSIKSGKVVIDPPVRTKIGPFQLQYNFIRGYRPKGAARMVDVPLNKPLDPEDFNFTKPVLQSEKFYSMKIDDIKFDFFFNKYPFAPYHFILVPNKEELHNQYLDPKNDGRIMRAVSKIINNGSFGDSIRLGYNSYGAHASRNHLHWQGFFVGDGWEPPFEEVIRTMPLESDKIIEGHHLQNSLWIPNSERADESLEAHIQEVNERYQRGEDIRFNLYYSPQGIAFFPRRSQGNPTYFELLQNSPFTTGYAFFEMLGEIICPDKTVFDSYSKKKDEKAIRTLYDSLSVDWTPISEPTHSK